MDFKKFRKLAHTELSLDTELMRELIERIPILDVRRLIKSNLRIVEDEILMVYPDFRTAYDERVNLKNVSGGIEEIIIQQVFEGISFFKRFRICRKLTETATRIALQYIEPFVPKKEKEQMLTEFDLSPDPEDFEETVEQHSSSSTSTYKPY